jgi:hypothetical protein
MRLREVQHRVEQASHGKPTGHKTPEVLGHTAQEQPPSEFWKTTLKMVILAAVKELFGEELAEIERAREDRDRALKADESARREISLIQNRLAVCKSSLACLSHETSQVSHESDEGTFIGNLREERERLWAEQGKLRMRLIEAKAHAAKVETNVRQEADKFARRARQAYAQANTKRNEVHICLEQIFKEVDDQFGEAWSAALAFRDEVQVKPL